MQNTELEQFLVDPVMNSEENILVNAKWLQDQLRQVHTLTRVNNDQRLQINHLTSKVGYLRELVTEGFPQYRYLNVRG